MTKAITVTASDPRVFPFALAKIVTAPEISERTGAFIANITVNDTTVARVRNDGRGGCNLYEVVDRDAFAVIDGWARANIDATYEHLDLAVEELMNREAHVAFARENFRKGAPVTVVIASDPFYVEDDDEPLYAGEVIIGMTDIDALDEALATVPDAGPHIIYTAKETDS